uniref:Peptidase A1 domain-containing protein n=1 Tax=Oryza rufipogon TaxID=4529 RepID=A0A0E0R1V8_ORYRU
MGRLVATLVLVLCYCSATCTLAYGHGGGGLRRGLVEQAMRGRLLAYATPAAGGVAVPISWSSRALYSVANFTIGTPPQPVSGIIDLSGELVWTQCATCSHCFEQDLPLFDTSASSTFQAATCGAALCKSIPTRNCSSGSGSGAGAGVCRYAAPSRFGDTFGFAGVDTVAMGTAKGKLAFGCVEEISHHVETIGGASGFVGLGRTPWSLVGQSNATAFSYCLAPHNDSGKNSVLFIGASAKLAGGGKNTSTPLVRTSNSSSDDGSDPFYTVQLEGIKAGDVEIATAASGLTVQVDTVLPYSILVDSAYKALKKAVTAALGAPTAEAPTWYDLCFQKAKVSDAPDLVFTFQGGAALTMPPSKYLRSDGNGTVCLLIWNAAQLNLTDGVSILGSFQQENIHFLFDLKKGTVSFEPADCSSLT